MEKQQQVATKEANAYSAKCILLGILFIFAFCANVFVVCFTTITCIHLSHEVTSMKKQNEFYQRRMNNETIEIRKNMNESGHTLRQFIDGRMADIQHEVDQIQDMKTENTSAPDTGHHLSKNLKEASEHLNVLIFTIGNLSTDLSKINTSFDSKMSRLRGDLNSIRDDFIRLHRDLTQLNDSLHAKMAHISSSVVLAVRELRGELNTLNNSTSTKANELWKHWNRTNAELDDIVKLMSQQNESVHSKLAYHSDALYSEVKNVERKQQKFHNFTMTAVNKLHDELNHTRDSLKQSFTSHLSRANKQLYSAIDDTAKSLRSSIKDIDGKIDGVKKKFQKNIDNILKSQQEMKVEFSKSKAKFQEEDRKHDKDISGQVTRVNSAERRIDDLKKDLDSVTRKNSQLEQSLQNLRSIVDQMKNKANEMLKPNIFFVLSFTLTVTVFG